MNQTIHCLHCRSNVIWKNGVLPLGGQRYTCQDCHKHFTLGGKGRGTYDDGFKQKALHLYCHLCAGARKVAHLYDISTSTLVSRAKTHRTTCNVCKKKQK